MRIDYHRTLIADTARNAAFYAALKAAIVPGVTTVADIGAGTGLLGLMAARLGAKSVTMYETAAVADVAARIIRANRVRNCTVIACHSTEMMDPVPVDLVVSETLGNYAFEENIIATLNDAKARFLKPDGVIIPKSVAQTVAPVITDRIHTELTAWDHVGFDLDLSVARTMSLNNAYVRTFAASDLLDAGASAKVWDQVDFCAWDRDSGGSTPRHKIKSNRTGEARWDIRQRVTIYGFANWWDSYLAPSVQPGQPRGAITLSTSPLSPPTHWEQLYFPLLVPMNLGAGDSLLLALRSRSSQEGGTHLAWTATHLDVNDKLISRQAMDLDKGYLP